MIRTTSIIHTPAVILLLTLVFALMGGTATASAQESDESNAQFGIAPVGISGGYFDLKLEPGSTQVVQVELRNSGKADGNALLFPADVDTRVNGGVAIGMAGNPITGASHWLDLQEETVALAAGETRIHDVTIRVPEDAAPGEHLTSVVVQAAPDAEASESEAGVMLTMVSRQAVSVRITVPGPLDPALHIANAEHDTSRGASIMVFHAENQGNVLLKTAGEFVVSSADGQEVHRSTVAYNSIYANTETTLEAPLETMLEPGDYTVALTLSDEERNFRMESGPLRVNVPEPPADSQSNTEAVPASETETATQTVIEAQSAGLPGWALLVAIPVALIAGAAVAFVMMKRRMQPAVVHAQPQMVVRETPPATTTRMPVRQIRPPGSKEEDA